MTEWVWVGVCTVHIWTHHQPENKKIYRIIFMDFSYTHRKHCFTTSTLLQEYTIYNVHCALNKQTNTNKESSVNWNDYFYNLHSQTIWITNLKLHFNPYFTEDKNKSWPGMVDNMNTKWAIKLFYYVSVFRKCVSVLVLSRFSLELQYFKITIVITKKNIPHCASIFPNHHFYKCGVKERM